MTKEQFRAGDVVRLKSGGELMTVGDKDDAGRVECHWFEGKKKKSCLFAPAMLEKAYSPQPLVIIRNRDTRDT